MRARGGASPQPRFSAARMATTYMKLGHSYTSSHSRAELSLLPDATIRPSGLKHTEFTPKLCPSSVLAHATVSSAILRAKVIATIGVERRAILGEAILGERTTELGLEV